MLTEDGRNPAAVEVALNSEPTNSVTVTVKSTDPEAAKVSKTDGGAPFPSTISMTFTTEVWETTQTVYVFGVEDKIESESARFVDISFTANGGGYRSIMEKVSVSVSAGTENSGMTIGAPTILIDEGICRGNWRGKMG